MIFVTVGTHEQPFNRLVQYMDIWAGEHEEEVIIQIGYSSYEPKNCRWNKLYPYKDMLDMVKKARIVITHGGPSSFIMPLQIGKTPIVIPRRREFGEHVNNHQVDFCQAVVERQKNIILVKDVERLSDTINRYDEIALGLQNGLECHNIKFCSEFKKIIEAIV